MSKTGCPLSSRTLSLQGTGPRNKELQYNVICIVSDGSQVLCDREQVTKQAEVGRDHGKESLVRESLPTEDTQTSKMCV